MIYFCFFLLASVFGQKEPLGNRDCWTVVKPGVTTTVVGHASLVDTGSHQRIIDVAGVVNMATGLLGPTVTISSVVSGEAVADGIAAYDYVNNQVYFSSDGAFGGTVFYVDVAKLANLPPASYYLTPVAFLGFDGVSGSRIIAGINTPSKGFLMLDKANYGQLTMYQIPSGFPITANDAYDGNSMTYYTNDCTALGTCSLSTWNVTTGGTSSFKLPCISSNGFLSGAMFTNGTHVIGLQGDTTSGYNAVLINPKTKTCQLYPLTGLPPKPTIIVSAQYGYKSGSLFVSVTSDVYNAIVIFDENFKFVSSTKTGEYLYEDIFVSEF